MISARYDKRVGIVHTVTRGDTSGEELETYLEKLFGLIARSRRDWGRYWHLVDARQLDIQSDANLRTLSGSGIELQEETDRTAVVMTSEPAVNQLHRMPSQFRTRTFANLSSARDWLMAPDTVVPVSIEDAQDLEQA